MKQLGSKGKKRLASSSCTLRSQIPSCLYTGRSAIAALLLLTLRKEQKNSLECGIYLRSPTKNSLVS